MPAAPNSQLDAELVESTLATPSRLPPSGQCPQRRTVAAAQSAASSDFPCIAPQPFDAYVVLDFEATCEEDRRIADAEVIEFPMILVDARTATPVAEFQRYVRPVKNPVLSRFCTELTGITQDMVSGRDPFPVVYCEALQFLAEAGLGDAPPMRSYCVVTCGDWDLKTMLPAQMRVSGQQGTPLSFQRWCNLKKCMSQLGFGNGSGCGGAAPPLRPSGMPDMLQMLGLPLQGRHHSGIDDCRNLTAVLCALLRRGLVIDVTFSTAPFRRWHAPTEAQLPALDALPSTLADGAAQHSGDVPSPPRSHARTEGDAPKPKKGRSAYRHASSVDFILPTLVLDANRDAVQELLSDTNAADAPSRVFDEEELKTASKFMSTLLRHKAIQWRVPITSNGYVLLDDVLRQPQMRKQHVSVQDVARIVRDSDKQRYRLAYGAADGRLYIAAVQGHSIDGVEPQLRTLTSVEEVPVAVHGTYWAAWKAIQQCGYLSTMSRQHIHFAKGLINDEQVVSGMRKNVQLFVYLDVAAVLADGVALYESSNGVILTPGVGHTRQLPLKYVAKVVDRSNGRTIYPA
ncbi:phosphotransferase, putative [Leishmania donovani]|uniref:2'-phosphotransferase n=1 Tax=Leishmania donovani TaxID=5661 RepID=A0A3Q8IBU9_LEIDO|nr:phosphotransferase, putative [Leishmania donovani]AYU79165.1 phosphotransferase, putative [Leishmania donovani]TPP52214.1 RNA 2'-phosphotransferase, Tpt1 / KptA family protein [Leishmania donovani]CBZ34471.1 phosphotransferase, putative [Leishmania donovani]